jgi:small subunit ribosomal protein S4e
VFLRNRLKYALTYHEVKMILKERLVAIDGKVRTDVTFPCGFMDVVSMERTGENFRLLFDVKGRYTIHKIKAAEAKYKLCKIKKLSTGNKNVPFIVTHDGRTIRFPDPSARVDDTVKVDLDTGRVSEVFKFDVGNLAMITGGRNQGRVGVITHRDRHPGSFDIVHVKDSKGHEFATRIVNVFVIGHGTKPAVSLPRSAGGAGIKLTIAEERDNRLEAKARAAHN